MFSRKEKIKIAKAIEDILREINHPEMDISHIRFQLHIFGAHPWSYANIHEVRKDDTRTEDPNPWNEQAREILENCPCHRDCPGYTGKIIPSPIGGVYGLACLCVNRVCQHCKPKTI